MQTKLYAMIEDIRAQIFLYIKKSRYYSLEMDELTRVYNCADFIAFVGYDEKNGIIEDVFFCTL